MVRRVEVLGRRVDALQERLGLGLWRFLRPRERVGAVDDDASYVPKELFEQWEARDPVERYRRWLFEHAEMTREEEDEITSYVKRHLNEALERAEASPLPDPSTLLKGVYAVPEELDTPHHM